jgi:hypothetical protein
LASCPFVRTSSSLFVVAGTAADIQNASRFAQPEQLERPPIDIGEMFCGSVVEKLDQ